MHGEQLVVLLFRCHNLEARSKQLRANDQRHHTGDEEIHKRSNEVQVTNFFVVSGGDPVHKDIAFSRYPSIGETLWGSG